MTQGKNPQGEKDFPDIFPYNPKTELRQKEREPLTKTTSPKAMLGIVLAVGLFVEKKEKKTEAVVL